MSDRLYLFACPVTDTGKISELTKLPSLLPFEPYVSDGTLYSSGSPRTNPRYDELMDWAMTLPCMYIEKWPLGHLTRLFLKWCKLSAQDYAWQTKYSVGNLRGLTPPLSATDAESLLRRQLTRAIRTEELAPERLGEVEAFLNLHPDDWYFLEIG